MSEYPSFIQQLKPGEDAIHRVESNDVAPAHMWEPVPGWSNMLRDSNARGPRSALFNSYCRFIENHRDDEQMAEYVNYCQERIDAFMRIDGKSWAQQQKENLEWLWMALDPRTGVVLTAGATATVIVGGLVACGSEVEPPAIVVEQDERTQNHLDQLPTGEPQSAPGNTQPNQGVVEQEVVEEVSATATPEPTPQAEAIETPIIAATRVVGESVGGPISFTEQEMLRAEAELAKLAELGVVAVNAELTAEKNSNGTKIYFRDPEGRTDLNRAYGRGTDTIVAVDPYLVSGYLTLSAAEFTDGLSAYDPTLKVSRIETNDEGVFIGKDENGDVVGKRILFAMPDGSFRAQLLPSSAVVEANRVQVGDLVWYLDVASGEMIQVGASRVNQVTGIEETYDENGKWVEALSAEEIAEREATERLALETQAVHEYILNNTESIIHPSAGLQSLDIRFSDRLQQVIAERLREGGVDPIIEKPAFAIVSNPEKLEQVIGDSVILVKNGERVSLVDKKVTFAFLSADEEVAAEGQKLPFALTHAHGGGITERVYDAYLTSEDSVVVVVKLAPAWSTRYNSEFNDEAMVMIEGLYGVMADLGGPSRDEAYFEDTGYDDNMPGRAKGTTWFVNFFYSLTPRDHVWYEGSSYFADFREQIPRELWSVLNLE
jgi:hypothetical protein